MDGIIFGSTDQLMVNDFSKLMTSTFRMSMNRDINFFLGLKIKKIPQGIFIHREKYITKLLQKYSMDNCSSTKVLWPLVTKSKLIPPESYLIKRYIEEWGSLLYLITSKTYIVFEKRLCAKYQANPKVPYLNVVK